MRDNRGKFVKDPLSRERLSAAEQIERLTAWNFALATRLVELEGKVFIYEVLEKLTPEVHWDVDTYSPI